MRKFAVTIDVEAKVDGHASDDLVRSELTQAIADVLTRRKADNLNIVVSKKRPQP
jgi:hypothetical protein